MRKVAILSFSDGRQRVHDELSPYIEACAGRIAAALFATGEVEVLDGGVVHSNRTAAACARAVDAAGADAVILNVAVFSFPNFSAIAARLLHAPLLAISPVNGKYPGLGGLQATVNMIRQTGGQCEKVWGDMEDAPVLERVMRFVRAAGAATRLNGQVLGVFGGRSIGMGSGAANPDLLMQTFGVDVEHIDQLEIIRRAEQMDACAADDALAWLEQGTAAICWNSDKLTRDALRMQLNCYLALRDMVAEAGLDFVAVKCHTELSEHYCTQCISAAFCNDPYDWDGPKEPVVFACEADTDAALTMQVMKLIAGKPVLFLDFRHVFDAENLLALCNCGACATWYAAQSPRPAENLRRATLFPAVPKYAGKGCHVEFVAKAGPMTFARLTRRMEHYKLQAFTGVFVDAPAGLMEQTTPVWPHGYARIEGDLHKLVEAFECNHIHAVAGDYLEDLRLFCALKGIEFEAL